MKADIWGGKNNWFVKNGENDIMWDKFFSFLNSLENGTFNLIRNFFVDSL